MLLLPINIFTKIHDCIERTAVNLGFSWCNLIIPAIRRRFQLECTHPYDGPNCDTCSFGYFGYPFCQSKFHVVIQYINAKNSGAWKVKLYGIFQSLKPKEVAKSYPNIICTYLRNIHFQQIRRAWLTIWACHTQFNFELQFAII